jgi:predicted small secreted protein
MQQPRSYIPLEDKQIKSCKLMKAAGVCAAVVAVSLLLVACLQGAAPIGKELTGQFTDARQPKQTRGMQEFCSDLTGSAKQLCQAYVGAVKEDAWDAAAAWRKASPDTCEHWQTAYTLHQQLHRLCSVWCDAAVVSQSALALLPEVAVPTNFHPCGTEQVQTALAVCVSLFRTAAVACSGIEPECLRDDMLSSTAGSACRPLAEGAECGSDKQCSSGFCRGESLCYDTAFTCLAGSPSCCACGCLTAAVVSLC